MTAVNAETLFMTLMVWIIRNQPFLEIAMCVLMCLFCCTWNFYYLILQWGTTFGSNTNWPTHLMTTVSAKSLFLSLFYLFYFFFFFKQHGTSRFSDSWTASESAPASIDCNRTSKVLDGKANISVEPRKKKEKKSRTDCKKTLLHPSHTMWHAMNLEDCSYCSICKFCEGCFFFFFFACYCWVRSAGLLWREQAPITEPRQILRSPKERRSITIWLMLIYTPFAIMSDNPKSIQVTTTASAGVNPSVI